MTSITDTLDVPRTPLPEDAAARLTSAFASLEAVREDTERLLAELMRTATHLPVAFLTQLLRFRAGQGAGALCLTGMPIDADLPPTPTEPRGGRVKPGSVSDCGILLLAILLGEPVAYASEKHGALVQNVFPTRDQRTSSSNESSAIELEFHTELALSRTVPEQSFDVAAPDFVLLLALRSLPERSATTSIVQAKDLARRLDPVDVAALRQSQFQLRAPQSFTRDGDRPWSAPLALMRGLSEDPQVVFDIACGARALSPEAERALEALRRGCADLSVRRSVQLAPGDLLMIDNHRCAHARSPFDARFDGRDRWLQRVYVRRDLQGLVCAADRSFRVLA
ncbi:TauD/TfdA family dioxygenase [Solirubrobacter taibaiensis]|nr:TauD/TfdA family dioxygenase [Solirubrobacter taibaiensis]